MEKLLFLLRASLLVFFVTLGWAVLCGYPDPVRWALLFACIPLAFIFAP